jgi:hypothetical protein
VGAAQVNIIGMLCKAFSYDSSFFIAQILRRGREAGDERGLRLCGKRCGAPQYQSRGASFANNFS